MGFGLQQLLHGRFKPKFSHEPELTSSTTKTRTEKPRNVLAENIMKKKVPSKLDENSQV